MAVNAYHYGELARAIPAMLRLLAETATHVLSRYAHASQAERRTPRCTPLLGLVRTTSIATLAFLLLCGEGERQAGSDSPPPLEPPPNLARGSAPSASRRSSEHAASVQIVAPGVAGTRRAPLRRCAERSKSAHLQGLRSMGGTGLE